MEVTLTRRDTLWQYIDEAFVTLVDGVRMRVTLLDVMKRKVRVANIHSRKDSFEMDIGQFLRTFKFIDKNAKAQEGTSPE